MRDLISNEEKLQKHFFGILSACIDLISVDNRSLAIQKYTDCVNEISSTGRLAVELLIISGQALSSTKNVLCSQNVSMAQIIDCFYQVKKTGLQLMDTNASKAVLSYEFWLAIDLLQKTKAVEDFAFDYTVAPIMSRLTGVPDFFINKASRQIYNDTVSGIVPEQATEAQKILMFILSIAYIVLPSLYCLVNTKKNLNLVKIEINKKLMSLNAPQVQDVGSNSVKNKLLAEGDKKIYINSARVHNSISAAHKTKKHKKSFQYGKYHREERDKLISRGSNEENILNTDPRPYKKPDKKF